MRFHPLLLVSTCLLSGAVLAGCFAGDDLDGDDEDAPWGDPGVFRETVYVNQFMTHPYPNGMLTGVGFSLDHGSDAFEPPVFRVKEGQKVEITLVNTDPLGLNHTIHWHGMHVPWDMDGVPYVTQDPVQPGESFTYTFTAGPAGTHWFHCHVDAPHHIDMGMYGVIIVEPKAGDPYKGDHEQVLILDSWDSRHIHQTSLDADMLLMSLRDGSGDPFNQLSRTEFLLRETINDPRYPVVGEHYENPLRQKRDWYPETHPPWQPEYDTFTINGMSYPLTEPITIEEGKSLKLRLVNVGHSFHAMHVHGHHFKVTHKDGYLLSNPWMADTVVIGPGERYDVLLEGNNPGIWMLHDHVGPHGMNDFIAPGGMKTHIVYEGWHHEQTGDDHEHRLHSMRAGDFLGLYTRR